MFILFKFKVGNKMTFFFLFKLIKANIGYFHFAVTLTFKKAIQMLLVTGRLDMVIIYVK